MYIRIKKNSDGSHATMTGGALPDGWAVIPDGMARPASFPYVNIVTAVVTHPAIVRKTSVMVNGKPVEKETVIRPAFAQREVISMTEGEKIPVEVPQEAPTAQDDTDAMIVDHEYRLTLLELFSDFTV